MRLYYGIFLLLLFMQCATAQKTTNDFANLNGTWLPTKQELGGKTFPPAVYEKQKLIIADSNYTVIAESVDKGVVKTDGGKMDIYSREGVNAGKHFTALYKLENGILTICYNLQGTEYPSSFETAGKPLYFLSVFRKGDDKSPNL